MVAKNFPDICLSKTSKYSILCNYKNKSKHINNIIYEYSEKIDDDAIEGTDY